MQSGGAGGETTVALLGSTGSIGSQAVDVVRAHPDQFRVVGLGAQRSIDRLAEQAFLLRPEAVAIGDDTLAGALAARVPAGTEVLAGVDGLRELASRAEVVLNAVVGFAGLPVTLAALHAGRRLALANKQSFIAGAPVVQAVRNASGGSIVPVDSEHCALHQCLRAGAFGEVGRLVLTASGGPFRGRTPAELHAVGVDEALAHPTWQMGPQNTVDSSTLMNKGLEVIEAHELFGIDYDAIEVVVHPQSVVHSMVEFCDGSTVAQLSMPDMRLPIGYALGYPERLPHPFGAIDWTALGRLDFEPPDRDAFRCLALAEAAGRAGGHAPAWLNAANEVAVDAFLDKRLPWRAIAEVVEATLAQCEAGSPVSVEEVVASDRRARSVAGAIVDDREWAA
ncbi:MAG: 1-deoxy-D-xylulose-5-phosphate reductoisomerase [Actinomycetota bacterium]|jgi:1-deoxy-D-xylulose-5-phosphate reductoisomerase|nr:1-deoxy-D-xylulose-5-phosphate reductoisomerase [Actinomycetota bacterium]MDA8281592.1 1-deoxy-D-xylulose-5-phosphate reductoisomerase [Actinomycetota bacterium]